MGEHGSFDAPTWAWILWVAGGLIAGLIAASKGRSIIGWGVLGLAFSVISILVVALLPAKDASPVER